MYWVPRSLRYPHVIENSKAQKIGVGYQHVILASQVITKKPCSNETMLYLSQICWLVYSSVLPMSGIECCNIKGTFHLCFEMIRCIIGKSRQQ